MRKILVWFAGLVLLVSGGVAVADLSVKDGGGTTRTVFGFVCFTTKLCNATTLIDSAGTEISPATSGQIGATTDAAATAGSTGSLAAKLRLITTQLDTLNANVSAAIPAGTNRIGYTTNDPCSNKVKVNKPFTTNGTSSVELVAVSGSTTIYVCSLSFIAAGATTVAFTTGTGTACATGNAAVIGSTTANIANSMSFAANGGMTLGGGGGTVALGASSSALCMVNGTNVYVSGNLTYVQE